MTVERVLEILEEGLRHERRKANCCAVEGEDLWAMAHTYGELLLEKILTKIKKEENDAKGDVPGAGLGDNQYAG